MGFSAKQLKSLQRPLDPRVIKIRDHNGRQLSYIEGWHAVAEANRIFGFDKWNRETIDARCILNREARGQHLVVYSAKVRITVNAGNEIIIREGQGTGEAKDGSPGEIHDKALKSAETDATKRALATFGPPFGLSLYLTPKALRQARAPSQSQTQTPATASLATKTAINGVAEVTGMAVLGTEKMESHEYSTSGECGKSSPVPTSIPAHDAAESVSAISNSTGTEVCKLGESASRAGLDQAPPMISGNCGEPQGDNTDGSPAEVPPLEEALTNVASLPFSSERRASIDKSVLTLSEPRRRRDRTHLRFVASEPCLLCGRQPADAHHLRFMQPRAMGRKVSDEFTVPLCRTHHRALHQSGNEAAWWDDLDIDAPSIAQGLWEQSHSATPIRNDHGATDEQRPSKEISVVNLPYEQKEI